MFQQVSFAPDPITGCLILHVEIRHENLVKEIWVAPECQISLNRDTLEEKLQAVGISMC